MIHQSTGTVKHLAVSQELLILFTHLHVFTHKLTYIVTYFSFYVLS